MVSQALQPRLAAVLVIHCWRPCICTSELSSRAYLSLSRSAQGVELLLRSV